MILKPVLKDSPLPLYFQVQESVRKCIASGSVKPGDKLPTEAQLSEWLGVSLITVRRAITDLQVEGLVNKVHGRGTFVATPPIEQTLEHLSGFAEDMEEHHRQSSAKVVRIDTVPATEEVCTHLNIKLKENVVRIERIRYASGEALMFNITYLPQNVGDIVIKEDLSTTPIFRILENKLGLPLTEADYQLEAAMIPENIREALGVSRNMPAFLVRRTSYTIDKRPIDYTQLYYRADRFRYTVHVRRRKAASPIIRLRQYKNGGQLT